MTQCKSCQVLVRPLSFGSGHFFGAIPFTCANRRLAGCVRAMAQYLTGGRHATVTMWANPWPAQEPNPMILLDEGISKRSRRNPAA
jgi:hypothetical protein